MSAQDASQSERTFNPTELAQRMLQRRAVEAVIWGMPAVNAELMFQAMGDAKADFNQVVYWSRPVSWKNQTLTPNPDTIYLMPFFNTKDAGPMVLEIPPAGKEGSITGSIDEAWQTAIEDVGPAGMDKGRGGKYLILPPGYKQKVSDDYIALGSMARSNRFTTRVGSLMILKKLSNQMLENETNAGERYRESQPDRNRRKKWLHKQNQLHQPRRYRLPPTTSFAPRQTEPLPAS
jgi:hypothetical protein